MKKVLFSLLTFFLSASIYGHDIEVKNIDGVTIYYNYINDRKELEVTYKPDDYGLYNCYNGNVYIPEEVTYMNRTRKVTSIGERAFYNCYSLTSISIPASVTTIGKESFSHSFNLPSVTIPSGVTSIGDYAFYGCVSLVSATISNSVTSIGCNAFYQCGLTYVTIPDNLTILRRAVFADCQNLTSIIIPNNVTTIENSVFNGCTSLTSITIPSNVKSIGQYAFYDCQLTEVHSKSENPSDIPSNVFSDDVYYNSTLYIPTGTADKYKSRNGWDKFTFIEEESNPDGPMCEMPTISYQNGTLKFYSTTEGVTYQYHITDSDIKSGSAVEVSLSVTYNISVYATKEGYKDSEVATATLCWIDADPWAEGTKEAEDNVTEVKAMPVLIQAEGNIISVQGAAEGTDISVYNTAGIKLNSTIANKGITTLNTSLSSGSTAIVKIGEKSVKVLVK